MTRARPAARGLPIAIVVLALAPAHAATSTTLEPTIPSTFVADTAPSLRRVGAVLMYAGTPFSGWIEERREGRVFARTPYVGGLEEGIAQAWYGNGALRFQKLYRHGARQGEHRGYWPNGRTQFVFNYRDDLFEGEQLALHASGARSEVTHYRDGHEDGNQRHWSDDGRLQSNYTIQDGRRYGLVGSFDCVSTRKH